MPRASSPRLHLNDDLRQQKIEWRIQRIVWPLMTLLLLAIVAGLLGQGPIARAQAGSGDAGVTMEYHRFLRRLAPDRLELKLLASSERVRLHIDARYLDAVELERVFPEPEAVLSGTEATTLEFAGRPGHWTVVHIELNPQAIGTIEGWVAVDQRAHQPFSQFVYP
ncbi:hypothetical protein M8A51_08700 [Schlegelella sp. S2-27]|uniref:Uncharacterized protein n=1 Tax=Caldimonas mangrovi TaxID=2944811 RepID=A0ABT0YLK0_9BURK|nr:hypothetical protein [Caldimonas mangrovi]MCM5679610.1 hypothetical protein [Caldimonas mangrovi]